MKFCDFEDWSSHEYVAIMTPKKEEWSEWHHCPEDYWIGAATVKYVDFLGSGRTLGDDTGIEGLKFKCMNEDGDEKIISYNGDQGSWRGWTTIHEGSYLYKATPRTDMSGGTDWAGLTGLKITLCEP